MKKKIIICVVIMLATVLLLAACGRRSNNGYETDDYIVDEYIETIIPEAEPEPAPEPTPTPEPEAEEYKSEPEVIVCENMPDEAVQLILRHFEAIESSDMQTLLYTFDAGGANFVQRHYINWIAGVLINRYADTGLRVVEIEGFWGSVLYVHAHIANNLDDDIRRIVFFMDGGHFEGHPWYITRYADDFGYYSTLGFVNFEGIMVDSRISTAQAPLIHAITNFFEALDSGNIPRLMEQQGTSFTARYEQFLSGFQGANTSVKRIEILYEHHLFWDLSTVGVSVTVNHAVFGLDTVFSMTFEPFERLAGEELWRLSRPFINVSVIINEELHHVDNTNQSIFDWMALNFIMNNYPALFLDQSVTWGVSDAPHFHMGIDRFIPVPKGMIHSENEVTGPTGFWMYRLPGNPGEEDIFILVVTFDSFWYGGQQVYSFFDGEFRPIAYFSRAGILFWLGGPASTPFISIRSSGTYNFYSFDMDALRERNELSLRSIRRQVSSDIVHEEPRYERLTRHIGIHNIERLESIATVWSWGDPAHGRFDYPAIQAQAIAQSVAHITHPAERLMLALANNMPVIKDAERVAIILSADNNSEWILISDDNMYMFDPSNPRLFSFIGSTLPDEDRYTVEMHEGTGFEDIVWFLRGMVRGP